MSSKYASIEERIIANTILAEDSYHDGTPCWLWTGKVVKSRGGALYPVMTMRYASGPRKGKVHNVRVHRKVIEVFCGRRMTPKMVAMHLCNNSLCCNPAHLAGGSQKKNVWQCVADGRHKTPFRDPEKRVAI